MSSKIPENIRNEMSRSRINRKVDLKILEKISEIKLLLMSRRRKFISDLKKFKEFFESGLWKQLHDQPNSHELAFNFLIELFGERNVNIYDESRSIHGHILWNKLTDDQKDFIRNIDSNKKLGLYTYKGLYIMYIGSTATVTNPDISGDEWKEIDEWNWSWGSFNKWSNNN